MTNIATSQKAIQAAVRPNKTKTETATQATVRPIVAAHSRVQTRAATIKTAALDANNTGTTAQSKSRITCLPASNTGRLAKGKNAAATGALSAVRTRASACNAGPAKVAATAQAAEVHVKKTTKSKAVSKSQLAVAH